MKTIIAILVVLTLSVGCRQANAFGDREQGVLIGVAASYIIGQAMQPRQVQPQVIYVPQQPQVVYQQQPQVIYVERPRRMTKGWQFDPRCNCYYEVWREH